MKNNTIEIVNTILAIWDPMDLIEITQNTEEYRTEATEIAKYINNKNPNVDDLAQNIQEIFAEYFNDEIIDIETTKIIADCILKNLEEE